MSDLWHSFLTNSQRSMHKWKHYFPAYENHFSIFKNRDVTIFEIGLVDGGSLQMWKRFFGPHCRIVGMDINPNLAMFAEDQIEIRIGDQSDHEFLKGVISEFGVPDIVIDDGSHVMSHITKTFDFLYPLVPKKGVYLVEDLQTAYWGDFEGGLRRKDTFIGRRKGLIDELNAEHIGVAMPPTDFTKTTLSMHFYDGVVAFEKGRHTSKQALRTG